MESKLARYDALVTRRKKCGACTPELTNPSQIEAGQFDTDGHVGPWSGWQGNLDARLLIIGQEWADRDTYRRCKGKDDSNNPTNRNLLQLLASIGISCAPDIDGTTAPVFLTNAVLCLKDGRMQAPVKSRWFANCGERFLRNTIEIVAAPMVISLGDHAFRAVRALYDLPFQTLSEAVEHPTPIQVTPASSYLAMYHCGARVMNTVRRKDRQLRDWQRVRRFLDHE